MIYCGSRWQIQKNKATGSLECYAFCESEFSFPYLAAEEWKVVKKGRIFNSEESQSSILVSPVDSLELLLEKDRSAATTRFMGQAQDSEEVNVPVVVEALRLARLGGDKPEMVKLALRCVKAVAGQSDVNRSALGAAPNVMRLIIEVMNEFHRKEDHVVIIEDVLRSIVLLCSHKIDYLSAGNHQNIRILLGVKDSCSIIFRTVKYCYKNVNVARDG